MKAVQYPDLQIISLPGRLNRDTLSFVGSEIPTYLRTYNITKAFMASTGVTIQNGLTNASADEYAIKKNGRRKQPDPLFTLRPYKIREICTHDLLST